jgi:hypothetical protein
VQQHGARFDVDLHRIVTQTVVPETGEKLSISGLLALPVGVRGSFPCFRGSTAPFCPLIRCLRT